MNMGLLSQRREGYRERLYHHYLTTHHGDLQQARRGLLAAAPYLKKVIRKHLPQDRNTRILDLGCGYGALLYWLQQAGYRNLEGIDRSAEQVATQQVSASQGRAVLPRASSGRIALKRGLLNGMKYSMTAWGKETPGVVQV